MSQNISGLTGLTPNNYPTNTRQVFDANTTVTVAMPAAGSKANTNAIDLGDPVSGVPYVTTETINVGVLTSASNNGNSNVATITLQDTKANTDGTPNAAAWANIAQCGSVNVTSGASSTAATNYTGATAFKLPPASRRFIRASTNNPSGSVDLSDSTLTLRLEY